MHFDQFPIATFSRDGHHGAMGKSRDHASQLWDRAEECRALAALATHERTRTEYLELADLYLELAAKEEAIAKQAK